MGRFSSLIGIMEKILAGKSSCVINLSCMGDSISFPVTPSSFEVSTSYTNDELNISELGTVSMRGKRGLTSVKFSSFFPHKKSIFHIGNDPYNYIEKLKSFAESIEPCHLSITSTRVSLYVTIESLNYSEKDGTGDVYFDITLKEYRYLLKDSGESNPVTGLKSRIATTPSMTMVVAQGALDAFDLSSKLSQKILPIHQQDESITKVYKTLAKRGSIEQGESLKLSKKHLVVGEETINLGDE